MARALFTNVDFKLVKTDLPNGRCRVEQFFTADESDPAKGFDGHLTWRSVSAGDFLAAVALWTKLAPRVKSLGFSISADGLGASATGVALGALLKFQRLLIKATRELNDLGTEFGKKKGHIDKNFKHDD